jgi:hypothetical protein
MATGSSSVDLNLVIHIGVFNLTSIGLLSSDLAQVFL